MTPSEFYDENLIRLSGLPWADFVELIEMDYQGFSLSSRSASIASQGNHQIIDNFSIQFPALHINIIMHYFICTASCFTTPPPSAQPYQTSTR